MAKLLLITLLSVRIFCCLAQPPNCTSDISSQISWPKGYDPSESRFHVHNSIDIDADPDVVWGILTDAMNWERWYSGASKISLINPDETILTATSNFKWKTMGIHFETEIKEYIPGQLLAWESSKRSIRGYHVWLIVPTATGCRVITEESQNGWLTFFEKLFQGHKLERLHGDWLASLKILAETKSNQ